MKVIRNGTPFYCQVENRIREKISNNEWEVGSQIPTELKLMQMFGVSRAPLRQAISNLVNEGLLERLQGKGTFIRKMMLHDTPTGISMHPSESTRHKVLSIHREKGLKAESNLLQLPPDEEFTVITYLHCSAENAGILYNLTITYMPISRYPNIENHFFKNTIYDISKSVYGISLGYTITDFYAVKLKKEHAAHLLVKPDTPAISIRKLYYDLNDAPAFITVVYSHPFNGKVQVKNAL